MINSLHIIIASTVLCLLATPLHNEVYAQKKMSFQERLDQLKPEVKQTLVDNIRRYWTIKTAQKMQSQGFSQQEIEQVLLSPSFNFFLDQILNDPKTQSSMDDYIQATLNEKQLLQHIQSLQKQRKQQELQEYKEVLRIIAQMRKEQNYKKEKKSWYQRFFEDFKFF
ncbi:hypothetical protein MRY82_09680 [bacterium]|nr:hypothetical protein [bacterium]